MRYLLRLLLIVFAVSVQADSLDRIGHSNLTLLGEGRLSFLFWDVYDARLYVTDGSYHAEKPFALSVRYLRDFSGTDISKRSIKEMKQQGVSDEAVLKSWEEQLNIIFPDVVVGDEIIGVSDPSGGARFFLNGELIGTILDQTLSSRYFDIWLSEQTSEPELRQSLIRIDR
jgi:hypothetical protein